METVAGPGIRWERLCRDIAERKVIAVVGNEMYKMPQNGLLVNLDDHIGAILTKKYDGNDVSSHSLAAIIDHLQNREDVDIRDMIDDLQNIVRDCRQFPLIDDLMQVDGIYFYVNTTVFGNILGDSIAATRPARAKEVNYSINESFADYGNLNELDVPFIFNMFGSLSNNVDPALKEEEMLEFTTSLITKMDDEKFAAILDIFKNKTLLFLGCSQPNWMIRFMFRLLSNDRLDNWPKRRTFIVIVNDANDEREAQFEFLKNYKAVTYDSNVPDFIAELKERWSEYSSKHPPKPRQIFLSYSHKDVAAAERLYQKICAIDAVHCWFDKPELESGDNFNEKIIANINEADLFIPLISSNSITGDNSYVKREWFCAYNQNVMRQIKSQGRQNKYQLPVVIDDTNLSNPVIGEFFPSISIANAPQGEADEKFMETIRRQLQLI